MSPIVGLTDTHEGVGLPIIGRLYKGDEKREMTKNGRTIEVVGKDLDYFRVEFEPQYEHLRDLFVELYGDKPTEFEPVFFTGSTVDEVFSTWKEEWTATALLHRCDGEHQVTHYNAQTGFYSRAKIECAQVSGAGCDCKQTGRLNLLFPALIDVSGVLGTISVSTHSINDILTVYRYLSTIQRVHGTLAGVPFRFGRAAQELSAPKTTRQGERTGERMKITKSLFYIHVTGEFTQERLLPMLAGALPALQATNSTQAALPEMSVEQTRRLLGNGGSRRIGGEDVIENEPPDAPPEEPTFTKWTVVGMKDFIARWGQAGVTVETLKLILRVNHSWDELKKNYPTVEEADAAVREWTQGQIETVDAASLAADEIPM